MEAEQAVMDALQRFQDRLDNLRVLLGAVQHYPCFDDEDRQWVAGAIEHLEKQRESDEEAMQQLLVQTAELEERAALVAQRRQVLRDLDTENRCLKDNKRLFRKFVAKQKKLEDELEELQAKRDALARGVH